MTSQFVRFWTDVNNNQIIPQAYQNAMEQAGSEMLPWAYMAYVPNAFDRIDSITPDLFIPSNVAFDRLDGGGLIICGRVGECREERVFETLDEGTCLVRKDLFGVEAPTELLSSFKQLVLFDPFRLVTPLPVEFMHQDFFRVELGEAHERDRLCTMTGEEARALVSEFIQEQLPEAYENQRYKSMGTRVHSNWEPSGRSTTWTNGYVVQHALLSEGVPIWRDRLQVSIVGDEIRHAIARCHRDLATQEERQESEMASVMACRDALLLSLDQFKEGLDIEGAYEVLDAELHYVSWGDFVRRDPKKLRPANEFVLAWRLQVNLSYEGMGSARQVKNVWVDATTGEWLGHSD